MEPRLKELLDRMVGVPRDNTSASEKHEVYDYVHAMQKQLDYLDEARAWLNTITGAAFFGPTAPDTASMQFTITLNAAEWREMRAIVDSGASASGKTKA